jgi:hypothetical protein
MGQRKNCDRLASRTDLAGIPRVFGDDQEIAAGRNQSVEHSASLAKFGRVRRPAVIRPRGFHFRRVHPLHQAEVIVRVLGRHADATRKIEQKPGGARDQVGRGDQADSIYGDRAAQGIAASAKDIDAQSGIGVDELRDDFAGRVKRVNVAEEEVASEAGGDGAEVGSHEIEVVQSASGSARVVNFDGQPAGERPWANVMVRQLAECARRPIGVRNG